jgi:hypothetical protein
MKHLFVIVVLLSFFLTACSGNNLPPQCSIISHDITGDGQPDQAVDCDWSPTYFASNVEARAAFQALPVSVQETIQRGVNPGDLTGVLQLWLDNNK